MAGNIFLAPNPWTMDQLMAKLRRCYAELPVESIRACFDGLRVILVLYLINILTIFDLHLF
jgi:hypothetical protein